MGFRNRRPLSAVVWDFDGTLADTWECISASMKAAITEHGLFPMDHSVLRAAVGMSLPIMIDRVTGGVLAEAALDGVMATYEAVFDYVAPSKIALFPGVAEQLAAFDGEQVAQAVATSKPLRAVTRFLNSLGIDDLFAAVVADDMVTKKKPDPEMLELVASKLCITELGSAVMVGDASYDIRMGKAAGYRTCAVTWGNQSYHRLLAENPDYVVSEPAQLASTLLAERE